MIRVITPFNERILTLEYSLKTTLIFHTNLLYQAQWFSQMLRMLPGSQRSNIIF